VRSPEALGDTGVATSEIEHSLATMESRMRDINSGTSADVSPAVGTGSNTVHKMVVSGSVCLICNTLVTVDHGLCGSLAYNPQCTWFEDPCMV